ncbi:PAS domain S-box protein [Methanoculleus sp. Afa-1]|uniref:PAS domain S-box protein n=1 Tax=Methanoculleus formosensis TaxID=2590886 RepID=A0A9E5DG94_9EURY|nr:PAS domain S-box protein [Methanoculleus sp. Afa-1]MCT8338021.1 PAS domain S-box protein [Methanoculleus sp. Afa-1]
MQEEHDLPARILRALRFRPKGMTITEVAKQLGVTRNSVSKHLEIFLIAGKVDVRQIGNAKLYSLAQRVPISAFLCFTKNLILILDNDQRIVQVNDQCLRHLRQSKDDLIGRTIREAALPVVSTPEALAVIDELEREQVVADIRYAREDGEFFYQMQAIPTTFEDGEKGCTLVLEDITERKRYVRNMEFLARTGRDFKDMDATDDIYQYVARELYTLAPGFLVWVGIIDESDQMLVLKSVVGDPVAIAVTEQFTGMKVEGMAFPITKADTAELIRHLKLVKAPPLYRLMHMEVPEESCQQVEEAAGGIDTYLMGLVSRGRIVGDVGISIQAGTELPNQGLIEAFVRQAAIAIDRKIADDRLRQSLARELEQVRNLLFLSRTAMDFIEMDDSVDIYHYIGDRLHDLTPDSIIFVCTLDAEQREIRFRAIVGDSEQIDHLRDVTGTELIDVPFPIDEMLQSGFDVSAGRIFEISSLYHTLFHRIPEERCVQAEIELGPGRGFGRNFSCREGTQGCLLIQPTRPGDLTNREVIEAFANQVSVALLRRRARGNLLQSERRFRDLVDSSPISSAVIESDGRYTYINRAFTDLFGYTLADIPTGKDWLRLAFPEEAQRREAIAAWKTDRELAGPGRPRPRTFPVRCRDGTEKVILFRPVELSDGTEYVTYEDITEERRAYGMLLGEIAELRKK